MILQDFILKVVQTSTFRQTFVTSVGTILNGILGFLFYIILAKNLGPENFGLFVASITILTLVADIVDLGVNSSLVKFVGANISKGDTKKAYQFLKLGLQIKLMVWLLVLAMGELLASLIGTFIFQKPELTTPLRIVFIGVGGAMLFSFATSTLQAMSKFKLWSGINILTNLIRLLSLLIIISIGLLNLENSLIIYITLLFFGFFISLFLLPSRRIIYSEGQFGLIREFIGFSKFIALFTLIAAVSSRMDIFLTTRLLNNRDLGIYSAAIQMASIIPQLIGAIGTVIAPKFASFQTDLQMTKYLRKLLLLALVISLIGLLIIPLSNFFIPYFFGNKFLETIPVFNILFISMLVFLVSIPIHSAIIYYFSKPHFFVYLSLGHLMILSIGGFFLITNYGVKGAAAAVFFGMIFNFIIPSIYLLKIIK